MKYHSFPPYALEKEDNVRRMVSIAAASELVPDFSLRLLYLLSKADALGRECEDRDDFVAQVEMFAELAKENGCLDAPVGFASDLTRRAYFQGRDVWPQQELYDETWGEVVMMCGLPGTGKDYWISRNCEGIGALIVDSSVDSWVTKLKNRAITAASPGRHRPMMRAARAIKPLPTVMSFEKDPTVPMVK